MPPDPSFARPAHQLGTDPVFGSIPVAAAPSGGRGFALQPDGSIPPELLGSAVTGQVEADSSITAGTGFTVADTGTGTFTITFDPPFATAPTVVATLGNAGTTTRVIRVAAVTASTCSIAITGNDEPFNFVAFPTV